MATRYWIQGFLSGNEPAYPTDDEGYPLESEDDPQVKKWRAAIQLFAKPACGCDKSVFVSSVVKNFFPPPLGSSVNGASKRDSITCGEARVGAEGQMLARFVSDAQALQIDRIGVK